MHLHFEPAFDGEVSNGEISNRSDENAVNLRFVEPLINIYVQLIDHWNETYRMPVSGPQQEAAKDLPRPGRPAAAESFPR